jgi:hypothetical protein
MLRQDEIIVRLSKRIGFSAGIDNLPDRLKKFIIFFENKNLSAPLLKEFINANGLSGKSGDSFIMILKQLDFVSIAVTGAVFANINFNLLQNVRKMLSKDEDFDLTANSLIFEILHRQDGDIFANILEHDLDISTSGEALQRMAFKKYDILTEFYTANIVRLKIWNQIRFSQIKGKTKIERYNEIQKETFIDNSSVEKIIQPRKSWLRNFGILENNQIIKPFLEKLKKINEFDRNDNCHLFWPEPHELRTFKIAKDFTDEFFETKFINLCNEVILESKNINYQNFEISEKELLKSLKDCINIHGKTQIPREIFIRMVSARYLILGKIIINIDLSLEKLRTSRKVNLINLQGKGGALNIQK